jgi:hypothetical protein
MSMSTTLVPKLETNVVDETLLVTHYSLRFTNGK